MPRTVKFAFVIFMIGIAWLGYTNELNEVVNVFIDQFSYAYVDFSREFKERFLS